MGRRSATKNGLIQCEYCGEWYSTSYRHCPFCNEDGTGRWDDPATFEEEERYDDRPQKGGRRLAGDPYEGPSVLRILGTVLSLGLIVAAVCIVISVVKPLLTGGKDPSGEVSPSPTVESPLVESTESPSPEPEETEEPGVSETPTPTATPAPTGTPVPAETATPVPSVTVPAIVAPTSFKLSREDFTLSRQGEIYQIRVTYSPADARGDITWKSSDPNVASVSWNGTVTAVAPGTVTVTATVAGVGQKTCTVRCKWEGKENTGGTTTGSTNTSGTTGTTGSSTNTSGLSLNRTDFTLSRAGETWKLTVAGTTSAVTWSTSDASVATVGSDGTVTAVGKGTCNVTATVGGTTLKCIVRCNF